jgi:hypothetical protein
MNDLGILTAVGMGIIGAPGLNVEALIIYYAALIIGKRYHLLSEPIY